LDRTNELHNRSDSLEEVLDVAFGPGPASTCPEPASPCWGVGKPEVPGYKVEEMLGRGSYGVVWSAREENTGIVVAIKFFAHGTGQEWQLLQAEVKQLAMLQADPGIVQLRDVEPHGSPPYYIMAYAEKGCL